MQSKTKSIAYWAATGIVVIAMLSGGIAELTHRPETIDGMKQLGYPLYFVMIIGVWKLLGALALVAPRFPRLKEWAYAGSFFLWSGAVASHLLAGDGVQAWLTPLVFLVFGIMSWALRPADRRLPNAGLAAETRPLAWAVPIGVLLLLFVVSYLTLPAVNAALHKRAVDLGWIAR